MAGQNRTRKARGVGEIVKQTLSAWHISSHVGCNCDALTNELDAVGADAIEILFDEYVDKFIESSKTWRETGNLIQRHIPLPPRFVFEELLEYGITKHREESSASPD